MDADVTTRRERERAADQQRAEARERVRAAQQQEAQQRADRRQQAQLRASTRMPSRHGSVSRGTPQPSVPAGDDDKPAAAKPAQSEGDGRAQED